MACKISRNNIFFYILIAGKNLVGLLYKRLLEVELLLCRKKYLQQKSFTSEPKS